MEEKQTAKEKNTAVEKSTADENKPKILKEKASKKLIEKTEEKTKEKTEEKVKENTKEKIEEAGEIIKSETGSRAVQYEDAALKIMMQFFADELLSKFGIEGKVVSTAPTESVYLELKRLYEDFNLIMEDGSWKHFEFQSTNEGKGGLKRFRSYEAVASYQHNVEITTYVLFSGTIQNPMTEYTEGINTYRVVPIIMKGRNADILIRELREKMARGEKITKSDLVELTLCPLMDGEMPQKDRIKAAFKITKETQEITPGEKQTIEAVIYTMAEKFLDSVSMEEIREAIRMTKLGEMMVRDGIKQGIEQAKLENAKNLLDLLDEETIADRIGLPLETVQKLKEEIEQANNVKPE